jgi:hypothetical protein
MLDAGIISLSLPIGKILPGTGFWYNSTKTTFCLAFFIIQKNPVKQICLVQDQLQKNIFK